MSNQNPPGFPPGHPGYPAPIPGHDPRAYPGGAAAIPQGYPQAPPQGYAPPVAPQGYPQAAPPPAASPFDLADDLAFQGKSRKFKGGFSGVVECIGSEMLIVKNQQGSQEKRYFTKFRVIDVKTNSAADPLAPGDERTWSALVTRSGDQQNIVIMLCLMHGMNPQDPQQFAAMKANVAVQAQAAARGSTYLAGKRVFLTAEDVTTKGGRPFVAINFYPAPV
jgi:hypothetical protein